MTSKQSLIGQREQVLKDNKVTDQCVDSSRDLFYNPQKEIGGVAVIPASKTGAVK